MNNYLSVLKECLDTGTVRKDRTGTGTIAKFGTQMRFDLSEGFPLVTTKKVHFKSIVHDLYSVGFKGSCFCSNWF